MTVSELMDKLEKLEDMGKGDMQVVVSNQQPNGKGRLTKVMVCGTARAWPEWKDIRGTSTRRYRGECQKPDKTLPETQVVLIN